ncbi:MAG: lipoyl synthase [Peptococcaceae bacterium]|nr:lipoyl synthase [Peptococcaceae bacterium]
MRNRKPQWLKIKIANAGQVNNLSEMLRRLNLHTVCEEANCPNVMECFGRRTATFMILGKECTRNCTFCSVSKGMPRPVDPEEPNKVAEAVKELNLKHVVITSVTRDDLPDGGAGHFAAVIEAVHNAAPRATVEVLIPDFQGDLQALIKVIKAKPLVINHNMETVRRLYPAVRPMADYARSLELLKRVKELEPGIISKSGFMLGLGETKEEVVQLLQDLRKFACEMVTIGQYLAPSQKHHPVVEYVHPDVFKKYKDIATEMGFRYVASSPLVRSSYHAGEAID